MYLVVELKNDEVAMVSEEWMINNNKEVMWPNFKNGYKIESALKQHKSPAADWTIWGVKKILYKTSKYLLVLMVGL